MSVTLKIEKTHEGADMELHSGRLITLRTAGYDPETEQELYGFDVRVPAGYAGLLFCGETSTPLPPGRHTLSGSTETAHLLFVKAEIVNRRIVGALGKGGEGAE